MGNTVNWIGARTPSPCSVREDLGLVETGEERSAPTAPICATHLPNGWYVILWQGIRSDDVASLASDEREAIAVTHGSAHARAVHYESGVRTWIVERDGTLGRLDLRAEGKLPIELSGIRAWHEHDQKHEEGAVDHLINVPLELVRRLTGYRHDKRANTDHLVWQVLAAEPVVETPPEPRITDEDVAAERAIEARSAPAPIGDVPIESREQEPSVAAAPVLATESLSQSTKDLAPPAPVPRSRKSLRQRMQHRIRLNRLRARHHASSVHTLAALGVGSQYGIDESAVLRAIAIQESRVRRADRRRARDAIMLESAGKPVPAAQRLRRRRPHMERSFLDTVIDAILRNPVGRAIAGWISGAAVSTRDVHARHPIDDPGIELSIEERARLLSKSKRRRRARQAEQETSA